MKLSKKLAAAALVLCMLLSVMPSFTAFATEGNTNIRSFSNKYMKLPETEIALGTASAVGAVSEGFRLVISDTTAFEKLGINKADILYPNRVYAQNNAFFKGLEVSGTAYVSDLKYDVPDDGSNSNKLMNNGGIVSFDFEGAEVGSFITNSGKTNIVLEIPWANVYAKATNIKAFDKTKVEGITETTTFNADTDTVSVESLSDANFLDPIGGVNSIQNLYYAKNITAKRGANYSAAKDVDMGVLPASSKIFVMDADLLYADSLGSKDGKNYWTIKNTDGYNNYYRDHADTTPIGDVAGPWTFIVPKFSGEYNVYAIKYGHQEQVKSTKGAINSVAYVFSGKGEASSWSNYLDAPTVQKSVTFVEGEPLLVEDVTFKSGTYAEGKLCAFVFVPVEETIDLTVQGAQKLKGLADAANAKELAAMDFDLMKPATYNGITVKEYAKGATEPTTTVVKAQPLWKRSQTAGGSITKLANNTEKPVYLANENIIHALTKHVTLDDLIAQYYDQIKGDGTATVWNPYLDQIYINGERQWYPKGVLIEDGDLVEIKHEDVAVVPVAADAENGITEKVACNTINASEIAGGMINATTHIRWRMGTKNIVDKGLTHLAAVTKSEAGAITYDKSVAHPIVNSVYSGYAVVKDYESYHKKATDAPEGFEGQRTYIRDAVPYRITYPLPPTDPTKTEDFASVLPEFKTIIGGYEKEFVTVDVNTPEGQKTVHDPEVINCYDGSDINLVYDLSNIYIAHSGAVTNLRIEELGEGYVLRADLLKQVRVIKVKADGSTETTRMDLTPADAHYFEVGEGEAVYIWEDTPYNGSTLKPLWAPITK